MRHGGHPQVAIQQQAEQHKKRASALRIKIISMGAPGVGKSCLIKRYCEEKFVSKYIGTIGVDYGVNVSVAHPHLLSLPQFCVRLLQVRIVQNSPSRQPHHTEG